MTRRSPYLKFTLKNIVSVSEKKLTKRAGSFYPQILHSEKTSLTIINDL